MAYTFTRTGAQIEEIHNTVEDPKSNSQFSDDIRTIAGEYRGLWPGTGGSANKGDTYQTQVGGTPAGEYYTALQNTSVDPVGDDVNWKVNISASNARNQNLLSNGQFKFASPDDSLPAPSATPQDYPAGFQIFSGWFADDVNGASGVTRVNDILNWTQDGVSSIYTLVPKDGDLTEYTASLAGKVSGTITAPDTSHVSFSDNGDGNWRITIANSATDIYSCKFEQGSVATGHEVDYGVVATGGKTPRTLSERFSDSVNVRDFGAVGDGVVDDTAAIQAAIAYAESFVEDTPAVDNRGGKDVVIPGGQYIVSSPIRLSKSNVSIIGIGKPTLVTNFPLAVAPENCAVLIIGSAEDWLGSPTISDTRKYNRVVNIRISRTGGGSPIGIMSTGTRNLTLRDIHVEQVWCALWLENTSEMTCEQFSSIGCNYGMIGDSRKVRPVGSSPLGIANTDNDCSSNTFNGFTAYYPQHTGILFINTGTSSIYSATIGRFSENPTSGTGLRYGLTGKAAGVHYWGANQNFTKAGVLDDIVYEPTPNESKTCILVTSDNTANPVRGLTLRNQHVQTWAADYGNNILTRLLVTESYNGGGIDSVVLKESGFTFATSGFLYPILVDQTPDASVGATVSDASVKIENCYPTVAVSTSNIGASRLDNIEYIEQTNMELNREAGGEPEGWALNAGTLTNLGGASGEEAYIRLEGNAGNPVYISKSFRYRYFTSRLGSPYISLWYRGDTAPHIDVVVNGVGATSRLTKSGENTGRYSNAIEDVPQSSNWRRAVYMFRPFSANFPFDTIELSIGRVANGLTNYTEIKGIEVGFYTIKEEPYNTF